MRGTPPWHEELATAIGHIIAAAVAFPVTIVATIKADLRERLGKTEMVPTPILTPSNVVDWVREFETRNGRKPKIAEVQASFPKLSRTTAWRKLRAA